jgi:hypothetical protein
MEGIQSDVNIDWAKGTVVILTYDHISEDGDLSISNFHPASFYLG